MVFQVHPQLAKDSFLIGRFDLCQLRLINDKQYPWFVLVPEISAIKEIYQLEDKQFTFWQESEQLSKVMMQHFNADKLNVAAIGNLVPQLHIHHIARFKSDPCWPKPVWGQLPMQPYKQQEVILMQKQLSNLLSNFKQNISLNSE